MSRSIIECDGLKKPVTVPVACRSWQPIGVERGSVVPLLCIFSLKYGKSNGGGEQTPLRTLLLRSLNVPGCSTSDAHTREISEMSVRKELTQKSKSALQCPTR